MATRRSSALESAPQVNSRSSACRCPRGGVAATNPKRRAPFGAVAKRTSGWASRAPPYNPQGFGSTLAPTSSTSTQVPEPESGTLHIPKEFTDTSFIGPKTQWIIPRIEYSDEAAAACPTVEQLNLCHWSVIVIPLLSRSLTSILALIVP